MKTTKYGIPIPHNKNGNPIPDVPGKYDQATKTTGAPTEHIPINRQHLADWAEATLTALLPDGQIATPEQTKIAHEIAEQALIIHNNTIPKPITNKQK